jgi:hypothetical protein
MSRWYYTLSGMTRTELLKKRRKGAECVGYFYLNLHPRLGKYAKGLSATV